MQKQSVQKGFDPLKIMEQMQQISKMA